MLCPCSANASRSSRGRSKPAANHSDSDCDFPLLCLTCSKRLGNRTIFGLRSPNPLLSGNNMTTFSIRIQWSRALEPMQQIKVYFPASTYIFPLRSCSLGEDIAIGCWRGNGPQSLQGIQPEVAVTAVQQAVRVKELQASDDNASSQASPAHDALNLSFAMSCKSSTHVMSPAKLIKHLCILLFLGR